MPHRSKLSVISVFLAILLLSASTVLAQTSGTIGISFAEITLDGCERTDTPGPQTVFVVHSPPLGATASRFRIQNGPGATLTYVSEVHRFSQTVGNTQTGITICYDGACLIGPELLVTITYMGYGTSGNCSELQVVPHPEAETVEAIGCAFEPVRTYVSNFRLNVGSGCGCGDTHLFAGTARAFGCSPLPVEESTWGRIKALYR
jgi:hypothetical protein